MVAVVAHRRTGLGCLLVVCLLATVLLASPGAGAGGSASTAAFGPNNTTESTTGRPVATVSGQTGAPLPTDPETGNPILAAEQTQTVRLELQTPNGTLGETSALLEGPLAYYSGTLTRRLNSSRLIWPPVNSSDSGQLGFITVTPVENGTGVVHLKYESGDDRRPLVSPDGEPMVFDVRPARPLSVDLSKTVAREGGTVEVAVTRENGAGGLPRAPVVLVDPDGAIQTTRTATAQGRVTLAIPADAETGNWSIAVRTAGFEPVQRSLTVQSQRLVVGDSVRPAVALSPEPGFEDVNGDGSADIVDVLTYLRYRDSGVIQNNSEAFDFDGDDRSGTLFDAVTLFVRVR